MALNFQLCSYYGDLNGPIYDNYADAISVSPQYLPDGHIDVLDDTTDPPTCVRTIRDLEIAMDYDYLVHGRSLKIRRLRCRPKRDIGIYQCAYASHPKEDPAHG